MKYPVMSDVTRTREMTSVFGGYNHKLSCQDGQFYDMRNMTSEYFPILSPRNRRGIVKKLTDPQGILDKEDLMWVDAGKLYSNGKEVSMTNVTISSDPTMCPKTMAKMGAYVVIFPDKIWLNVDNGEHGYMEEKVNITSGKTVSFTLCNNDGTAITWHDEEYYKTHTPANGDYMMTTSGGKAVLKIYSSTTSIWANVATTYIKIQATGIGAKSVKADGVKITIDNSQAKWSYAKNIFVNDEGNGKLSTNSIIYDRGNDYITVIGLIDQNKTFTNMPVEVKRDVPDMDFITECNNRLWGCSKDGHEIYCCKLGDVKNWNSFQGLSTDSWVVTVGSDGKFTGAITYLGYPMFFKEDCIIKIAVSATGGHQLKETRCRGVQRGSHRSLALANETLFYKTAGGVVTYNGSLPIGISEMLGEVRYEEAVGGTIDDRYYISMKDESGKSHMFSFDQNTGIWCKEDNTDVMYFCTHGSDLYFIDRKDKTMKSVRGSTLGQVGAREEGKIDWYVESGNIGYSSPDNKYVSRINVRISLEVGSNVDFYIRYNSEGEWEHKFNMNGNGTRTFTIPIIPKRCDHFTYKLIGKGGCKVHSITKTMEQGSDS